MAELKDANTNPWYVLMTLHGEQTGERADRELAERNRKAWNGWWAMRAGNKNTKALAVEVGVNNLELHPDQVAIHSISEHVKREVHLRCGANARVPLFKDLVDLSGHVFHNRVDLNGFVVPEVNFTGCRFEKPVSLDRSLFSGNLFLDHAVFENTLSFRSSRLVGAFSASGLTVKGTCKVVNSTLQHDVELDHCDFESGLSFVSSTCEEKVTLIATEFIKDTKFTNLKVAGKFDANDLKCAGQVSFQDCEFANTVSFVRSNFSKKVTFHRARFKGEQLFYDVKFLSEVSLNSAEFTGRSFWNNARFGKTAGGPSPDFRNARWKSHANFADAVFVGDFPRMAGTTFEEGVTFTGDKDNWPEPCKVEHATAKVRKESAAKLRHMMTQQGLPEEAHFFFRREMGFAGQIGGWWQRLPYRAFGWVSDYGQSIWRPMIGLLGLWVLGVIIYTFAFAARDIADGLHRFDPNAAGLSFANMFKFLGFQRTYFDVEDIREMNGWLQTWGGFQTIAGFVLLFFLGLGLRTKFRLR